MILARVVSANAQAASEAQIKALEDRIDQLQRTVDKTDGGAGKTRRNEAGAEGRRLKPKPRQLKPRPRRLKPKPRPGTVELDSNGHKFLEHKKGTPSTFLYQKAVRFRLWQPRRLVRRNDEGRQGLTLNGNSPRSEISAGCGRLDEHFLFGYPRFPKDWRPPLQTSYTS